VQLSNEAIWTIFLVADMCAVVAMYRWFGKEGLYAYMVLAIIACNIEVFKLVEMFGFTVTLGNILYGSLFLTTDILGEVHGKQEAKKAVWLGFVALVLMTGFIQLSIWMKPAPIDQAQAHLVGLFTFLPRIAIGSLTAYLLSQFCDVWIFHKVRGFTGPRKLWLRNKVGTMLSQAVDTTVFTMIAFAPIPALGIVPGFDTWSTVFTVWWTAYFLKLLVSVADTPFVYWARTIGRRVYGLDQGVPLRGTGETAFAAEGAV
jgi:queuosine precursor transporter